MSARIRWGGSRRSNTIVAKRRRRPCGLDLRFLPKISGKRSALLLATSLATGLVTGVAMAPRPALAQQAFLFNGAGPVTEVNNDDCTYGGTCIDVTTTGDNGDADITNNGELDAGGRGIDVVTQGEYADVTIDNNETVTADNDAIRGVTRGNFSYVFINNDSDLTSTDQRGVEALSEGQYADIYITNSGDIVDAGIDGIRARTEGDYADIYIANSGDIGAGEFGPGEIVDRDGIFAESLGEDGGIDVENSGAINADRRGMTVFTNEDASSIVIDNYVGGDITTTDGIGIYARTYGYQSGITVNNAASIDANGGISRDGIRTLVSAEDGASYDARTFISNSGVITADGDGIQAESENGGSSEIVIRNTGDLVAGDDGIFAETDGDNSYIDVVNNADITADDDGIDVRTEVFGNYGAADIDIYTNGVIVAGDNAIYARSISYESDIYIRAEGSLTSGDGDSGIYAKQDGYDGTVNIVVNSDVTAGSNGVNVYATSGNNNSITVTQGADSFINSGDDGIDVQTYNDTEYYTAGGNVTVTANGDIRAGEQGIDVDSSFSSYVTVNGDVYGLEGGIAFDAESSATILIGAGGRLTAGNDLAIEATGPGDADITIAGYMRGFVLLDADDDVIVSPGGEWRATGTSDFDSTGGGGDDNVLNYGTIRIADDDEIGVAVFFENLENLYNGGLITMVNDNAGDQFKLNFAEGNGVVDFIAGYSSRDSTLAVDTFFDAYSDDGLSDKLYVYGDTFGTTEVVVNVAGVGDQPDYYDGIPVVIVSGDTVELNFNLKDGPVQAGFFAWDLVLNPNLTGYNGYNAHKLITVGASSLGAEFASGITATQEIWHQTTGVWLDRNADLRLQLENGSMSTADLGASPVIEPDLPAGRSITPGVWAKGVGIWAERDRDDFDIDGANSEDDDDDISVSLSYDLDIAGVLGGIDIGRDNAVAGDAMLFGIMGGYLTSDLDFDSGSKWEFEGATVGGYATWLKGGFFVDALVKADFLDVEIDATPFGDDGETDTSVTSIGGRVDAGYKFGDRFFLEPQGTIAYVHTEFDEDVDIFGGDVAFDEDDSLRGRLGLRVGAAFETASLRVSPDVTGSVWQEFSGENAVEVGGFGDVDLPGFPDDFEDSDDETRGEVAVGLSAVSLTSGWSGFARGKFEASEDFEAYGVNGGLRYNW